MKIKIKRRRLFPGKGIAIAEADDNAIITNTAPAEAGAGTEGDPINVVGSDGKLNVVPKHSTWATPSAYPTELRAVNTGRTIRADASGLSVEGSAADFIHDPVAGVGGFYRGSRKVEFDLSSALGFDIVVDATGGVTLTHNASGRTISLLADGTAVQVETTGGDYGKVYTTGFEAYDDSAGNTVALDANGGLSLTDGTATATINPDGTVTIDNGTNNLTIDPALITHNMTVREIDVCDSGTPKQMLVIGSAPF